MNAQSAGTVKKEFLIPHRSATRQLLPLFAGLLLAVTFLKAGQDLQSPLSHLLDFLTAHAAGAVKDQGHLPLDGGTVGPRRRLRRKPRQQQEVSAAALEARVGVGK